MLGLTGEGAIDGGPGKEIDLPVKVSGQNSVLEEATVKALQNGSLYLSSQTKAEGKTNLSVERGKTYELTAQKDGCGEENLMYTVPEEGTPTTQTLSLDCGVQLSANETEICFTPSSIETVNYEKIGFRESVVETGECQSGTCALNLEEGFSYKFNSPSYVSESSYSKEQLEGYQGEDCIPMVEKENNEPDPTINYGEVIIWVKDEKGDSLGGKTVQLVQPNSTNIPIEGGEGTTKETEGSIGKVRFNLPLNTSFKVKVLSGEGTGTKLTNETTYEITPEPNVIPVIVKRYKGTPMEVIEKNNSEPLANTHIRIFKGEQQVYLGETNNEGEAEPVPNLKEESYQATVFKQGYSPKKVQVTGGEQKAVQLEKLGEYQAATIKATVKTDTETQERVEGAKIDIKSQNGTYLGYPTKETNTLGETTFKSVPKGEYCLEINWMGKNYPCSENTVTVRPSQESTATRTILITPIMHLLETRVMQSEEGVSEATVKGEDILGQEYGPKETDESGKTSFQVPHGRKVTLGVDKTINGEQYRPIKQVEMNEDKNIEFNLEENGPIDRDIEFQELQKHGTNQTYKEEAQLNKRTQYNAKFKVDLKKFREERWEEVTIDIYTENEVDLYPVSEADEWTGWNTNTEELPGKTQEVTINGEYTPSDGEATINVPLVIKPPAEQNITLNYQASWEKGSTNPQTQEKTISFTTNEGEGSEKGQFYVEKSLDLSGTKEDANVEDTQGAVYKVTRLEGGAFTGEMNFETRFNNTIFTGTSIKLKKPNGETKDIEEKTLKDSSLTFTLDEDKKLEENDELTVEIYNKPQYPASDVLINGGAGATDLGTLSYTTGGSITPTIRIPQSSSFDLSNTLDIKIYNNEKGAPLTTDQLRAVKRNSYSVVDGNALEGCSNIDLSKAEVTQDEKGENILRKELNSDCNLEEGMLNIHIEGGAIERETVEKSISKSFTVPNLDGVGITPGNTCPIDIAKQEENPLNPSYGIGKSDCKEDNPSELVIGYKESAEVDSGNIEIVPGSVELIPPEGVRSDIIEGLVDYSLSGNTITISSSETQGGNFEFGIQFKVKGTKGELTEERTQTIEDISVSPPVSQLGGNRFRRNAIQEYSSNEPYRCGERYCTLEQILEYSLQSASTGSTTEQVKMVDMGGVTTSQVRATLREVVERKDFDVYGDPTVIQGKLSGIDLSGDQTDPTFIVVNETQKTPGIGNNRMTVIKGNKSGKTYYYFSFKHLDEGASEPFMVENLGLWLPHTEKMTGEENEVIRERMETPIYIDETVTDNKDDIKSNLIEGIAEMWGVDKDDIDVIDSKFDYYEHGIHVGLCPNDASPADNENCDRLDKRDYSSIKPVIFRGSMEAKTYIHAPNEDTLLNLSKDFNRAFGNQRSGMALQMIKPDSQSEGALTFAPDELTYYCYTTSSHTSDCPGGDTTLSALRDVGETQAGVSTIELKKEEDYQEIINDDTKGVDWIVVSVDNTQNLARSGQMGCLSTERTTSCNTYITGEGGYIDLFGKGVDEESVRVPQGGIVYQPDGPSTLLVPDDNKGNADDLLYEFNFQLIPRRPIK